MWTSVPARNVVIGQEGQGIVGVMLAPTNIIPTTTGRTGTLFVSKQMSDTRIMDLKLDLRSKPTGRYEEKLNVTG